MPPSPGAALVLTTHGRNHRLQVFVEPLASQGHLLKAPQLRDAILVCHFGRDKRDQESPTYLRRALAHEDVDLLVDVAVPPSAEGRRIENEGEMGGGESLPNEPIPIVPTLQRLAVKPRIEVRCSQGVEHPRGEGSILAS